MEHCKRLWTSEWKESEGDFAVCKMCWWTSTFESSSWSVFLTPPPRLVSASTLTLLALLSSPSWFLPFSIAYIYLKLQLDTHCSMFWDELGGCSRPCSNFILESEGLRSRMHLGLYVKLNLCVLLPYFKITKASKLWWQPTLVWLSTLYHRISLW